MGGRQRAELLACIGRRMLTLMLAVQFLALPNATCATDEAMLDDAVGVVLPTDVVADTVVLRGLWNPRLFEDFQIEHDCLQPAFQIDSDTGTVTVLPHVSFETGTQFRFTVSARRRLSASGDQDPGQRRSLDTDFQQSLIESGVTVRDIRRLQRERVSQSVVVFIQASQKQQPVSSDAPPAGVSVSGKELADDLPNAPTEATDTETSDTETSNDNSVGIETAIVPFTLFDYSPNPDIESNVAEEDVAEEERSPAVASPAAASQHVELRQTVISPPDERSFVAESAVESVESTEVEPVEESQIPTTKRAVSGVRGEVVQSLERAGQARYLPFLACCVLTAVCGFAVRRAMNEVSSTGDFPPSPLQDSVESTRPETSQETDELADSTLLELFLTPDTKAVDEASTAAAAINGLSEQSATVVTPCLPIDEQLPARDSRQVLRDTSRLFRDISRQAATDAVSSATLHRSPGRKLRIAVLSSLTATSLAIAICGMLDILEWNLVNKLLLAATLVSAAEYQVFVQRWKRQTASEMSWKNASDAKMLSE